MVHAWRRVAAARGRRRRVLHRVCMRRSRHSMLRTFTDWRAACNTAAAARAKEARLGVLLVRAAQRRNRRTRNAVWISWARAAAAGREHRYTMAREEHENLQAVSAAFVMWLRAQREERRRRRAVAAARRRRDARTSTGCFRAWAAQTTEGLDAIASAEGRSWQMLQYMPARSSDVIQCPMSNVHITLSIGLPFDDVAGNV